MQEVLNALSYLFMVGLGFVAYNFVAVLFLFAIGAAALLPTRRIPGSQVASRLPAALRLVASGPGRNASAGTSAFPSSSETSDIRPAGHRLDPLGATPTGSLTA